MKIPAITSYNKESIQIIDNYLKIWFLYSKKYLDISQIKKLRMSMTRY